MNLFINLEYVDQTVSTTHYSMLAVIARQFPQPELSQTFETHDVRIEAMLL